MLGTTDASPFGIIELPFAVYDRASDMRHEQTAPEDRAEEVDDIDAYKASLLAIGVLLTRNKETVFVTSTHFSPTLVTVIKSFAVKRRWAPHLKAWVISARDNLQYSLIVSTLHDSIEQIGSEISFRRAEAEARSKANDQIALNLLRDEPDEDVDADTEQGVRVLGMYAGLAVEEDRRLLLPVDILPRLGAVVRIEDRYRRVAAIGNCFQIEREHVRYHGGYLTAYLHEDGAFVDFEADDVCEPPAPPLDLFSLFG